ncbi:YceI family protein [Sphingomonas canadensis]|uniref:YceI family protein n=1 Tax=Sphingomonas canadensis TaxID=1219257 RepID=A0ABW3H5C2_9SPHN|nr:YceI family protein [Sphingomonas canadensis]MCW3835491.1 YceI family protein [Sphingomonas canadensis]
MRLRTPARLRAIAVAAAVVLAAPVVAHQAAQLPGSADVSRVTAGTYAVDPGHTLIGWRVNHFGFNDYFGLFGDSTGTLTIDPARPGDAKVDITIPVRLVTTANAALTGHLLKPGQDGKPADFFGPAPADARFVSKRVTVNGTTAAILGDLTLNGVTRPVTLDAKFTGAGANPYNKKETIGFAATAEIKRSDFGIAYGIPMVSDAVQLDITAAFEKQ